jgi:hypothetical protein
MNLSLNTASLKKTALASAMVAALGGAMIEPAAATIYKFSFVGSNNNVFTMIDPTGNAAQVNSDGPGVNWYGFRTEITGTITYDTDTSSGTMSINPFSFFGGGAASATTITFQAIGNGDGNPASGNLLLGNMGFNWDPRPASRSASCGTPPASSVPSAGV